MAKNYIYEETYKGITYYAVRNDVNGNNRFVIHYPYILTYSDSLRIKKSQGYKTALNRAKEIGGKRYRARWYDGGIVFTTTDIRRTINQLIELRDEADK